MKLRITVEGVSYDVDVEVVDGAVASGSTTPTVATPAPVTSEPVEVKSPIAGTVLSVQVSSGDRIRTNETLMVLEAMKMESNITAPSDGTVREVCVKDGDSVSAGQLLVRLA